MVSRSDQRWVTALCDVTADGSDVGAVRVWTGHGTEVGAERMIASLNKSSWRRQARTVANRYRFVARDDVVDPPVYRDRAAALAAADCLVVDRDRFDDPRWLVGVPAKANWTDRQPSGHHLDVFVSRDRDATGHRVRLASILALPGGTVEPYDLRRGRNELSVRRVAIDVINLIGTGIGSYCPGSVIDVVTDLVPVDATKPWSVSYDEIAAQVHAHHACLDLRPHRPRDRPAAHHPIAEPAPDPGPEPGTDSQSRPTATPPTPVEMSAPQVPDRPVADRRTQHSRPDSTVLPVRLLDDALDAQIVRDIRDSAAPNTWKAYRADLTDFGSWLHGLDRDWADPATVADYVRALEIAGAKYATIERRITSISKLVEVLVAVGQLDPTETPTKHPTVTIALQAIRRRLGTDLDQAAPLTAERMIQVLLAIDTTTRAGRRDVALLLIGWYGAMRRSEITAIRRHHIDIDTHGAAIRLERTKASQDHSVVVPIARNTTSRWCPVTTLEEWLDELAHTDAGDTVWPWITKGDTYRTGHPAIGPAALDSLIDRRVRAAGLANPNSFSPHSLRAGFVTEAKNRGIDEADIMRHTRIKSLRIMRTFDRETGWWLRNPTTAMTL